MLQKGLSVLSDFITIRVISADWTNEKQANEVRQPCRPVSRGFQTVAYKGSMVRSDI